MFLYFELQFLSGHFEPRRYVFVQTSSRCVYQTEMSSSEFNSAFWNASAFSVSKWEYQPLPQAAVCNPGMLLLAPCVAARGEEIGFWSTVML